MMKIILKVAAVSFLWGVSLHLTAIYFFEHGARWGYHLAATECGLYAIQKQFEGE